MNGFNYLIQTNLYLLLFMGFYVLVLRNETFFRQNRFFLNTSIFLSFLIPFINSDWFRDLFITQKVREAAIVPSQMIFETIVVSVNAGASSLTVGDAIFRIYAAGATLLLIRFFIRLTFLKSNLKVEKGAAFSFFKTLVVDKNMPEAATIINHEKVHMRQWHSADIIFIELAAIVNWFNPVMYLYKKEIRHIHEFIADEEAADLMQSKSDYALLLFSNTLGVDPLHLSNNFFNKSLLKRRIIMLHKSKSRSTGLWKYGFSAPLFVLMLIVSAATASSERNVLSVDGEQSISSLEKIGIFSLPEIMKIKPENGSTLIAIENHISKSKTSNFPVGSTIKDVSPAVGSPVDLKKHIAKTINYTAAAKADKVNGYIQVNFMVTNKNISDVEITKNLHPELDEEVLKAFASFKSEIAIPDNDYALTVRFLDTQKPISEQMKDRVPKNTLFAKNYLGTVIAMIKEDGELNAGWDVATSRPNRLTGEQEVIGFDGTNPQDNIPGFPGGLKAWGDYLSGNLRYPPNARKNNIQGRVITSFVVNTDGTLGDIKILRGIGGGADEEAIRMLKNSPKWIPGTLNGKPAKIAYTMPIFFSLIPAPKAASTNANQESSLPADVKHFATVDVLPDPPGGMTGWGKYLTANLKYPAAAKKANITGRVIMEFIVEKDGSLSDIKVLRGIGGGADEEAVRVLNTSPNWKPGIQDGRPVRVAYTMPIFFQLASKPAETKP